MTIVPFLVFRVFFCNQHLWIVQQRRHRNLSLLSFIFIIIIMLDLFDASGEYLSCKKFQGTPSYSPNLQDVVGFTKMPPYHFWHFNDNFSPSKTKGVNFLVIGNFELTFCQRKRQFFFTTITTKSNFLRRLRPSVQISQIIYSPNQLFQVLNVITLK